MSASGGATGLDACRWHDGRAKHASARRADTQKMRRYGRLVTYEFDLVAESGELRLVERGFERVRLLCPNSNPLPG